MTITNVSEAEGLPETNIAYRSGRLEQARSLHRLGVSAGRARAFERAVHLFERALELAPDQAIVANDLGVALKSLDRREAALASYDRAIALEPNFAEARNNRANLLRQLGNSDAAPADYAYALAAKPGYAEAHNNRGVLLNEIHRWEEASASYDRAIACRPLYANAFCNRGVPLEHLGRLNEALASYDRAIAIDAAFVQAHVNRGNVLRQLQRPAEAVASCNRALALRPEEAQAHLNKALALLSMGDLSAGWKEYEWRWRSERTALFAAQRNFSQPLWLGQYSVSGRTLLIHSEQGIGDTLQFCRYVSLLAELGATVILEVQPPLVRLLRGFGAADVLARGEPLPAFDCHCPLLSLPLAFQTTLSNLPARNPYLQSDPDIRRVWSDRLGPKSKLRVGLVWSGGFRPEQPELWSVHGRRNIPLRLLAPLRHPAVDFYTLQKGEPAESELAQLTAADWDGPPLIDYTRWLRDFADTAALVDQLDLIISVDTSTAHLAGALGKRVWILDRFDSCWRWMLDRSDSPWYPTVRLYRQQRAGDWPQVVEQVRNDLFRLACPP